MYGDGYEVTSDLYSIAQRVKEIDDGYFIFYSYKDKRFEVHNKNQRGNTLSLVLPFSCLDERTIRHIRRTRSERVKLLMQEMERENEINERKIISDLITQKQNDLEDALIRLTKPKGDKNEVY